jgi:hypothetical protein
MAVQGMEQLKFFKRLDQHMDRQKRLYQYFLENQSKKMKGKSTSELDKIVNDPYCYMTPMKDNNGI